MKSRLPMLLLMKRLMSPEEIENMFRVYKGMGQKTIEKHFMVKAFVKNCLEETADYVITPKSEVFAVFEYFCRVNGLRGQDFPIIKINGLTSLLCLYIKFSETRTWRHGKQVRAFKGITIKGKVPT